MAKSKKRKNADFQKNKLKVGRSLPKGRNVTDTSFKTKKVLVPGQFSETSGSVPSTFKDYLNRVEHHNVDTRHEALKYIKNRIEEDNDHITTHLSKILKSVSEHFTDIASVVRTEAFGIFQYILERTQDTQIESFFPLLISHLCCAMTHLSLDIRKDSLKILDCILQTQPNNICHSTVILKQFLEQISVRSAKPKSKKKVQQARRRLRVAPDDNIQSQKWRLSVLKRLVLFLNAIIKNLEGEKNMEDQQTPEVKWNNKPLYLPLYAYGGLKPVVDVVNNQSHLSSSIDDCRHNISVLKTFTSDLMPLLCDIWKEETSQKCSSDRSEYILKKYTTEILSNVTQIVCCIGEWMKLVNKNKKDEDMVEWFKKEYSNSLYTLFNNSFPFFEDTLMEEAKEACMKLNLEICTLYSAFLMGTDHVNPVLQNSIEDYTLSLMQKDSFDNDEFCIDAIPTLLKITEHLLENDPECTITQAHLFGLQKLCESIDSSHENRKMLMTFFSTLVLDTKYRFLLEKSVAISSWLSNLLDELLHMNGEKVIDKNLINVILKVCARQYPAFTDSLQQKPEYLFYLLCSEDEIIQNSAADLITKIGYITPAFFQELSEILRRPAVSLRNVRYVVQHLSSRLLGEQIPSISLPAYIKFLFNLTTGIILNEENMLDHDVKDFATTWHGIAPFLSYSVFPSRSWKRHSEIIEITIQSLLWLPNHDNISMCTFYFLRQFLSGVPEMPIHCALGIFNLMNRVGCYKGYECQDEELNICLFELSLSCFAYGITLTSLVESVEEREEYGMSDLMKCVIPDRNAALNLVNLIQMKLHTHTYVPTSTIAHYVGTTLHLLIQKGFIGCDDLHHLAVILNALKDTLGEKVVHTQWWRNIYEFCCG